MKKLLISTLLLISSQVNAGISIIVHPSNNDVIDVEYVNKIFMGKIKAFPSGHKIKPVNLNASDLRTSFDTQVLSKTPSQLKAHWSKLIFTGKGTPPVEVSTVEEVIEYVRSNPQAIGYVDDATVNDSVRVVTTIR